MRFGYPLNVHLLLIKMELNKIYNEDCLVGMDKIDEIKDVAIKTYRTKRQAESGCSSWDRDFEVVECKEVYDIG